MLTEIKMLAAATLLCAAVPAMAQMQLPPCNGDYATIRTSEIKPGKMADFRAAVALHQKWYTDHNSPVKVRLLQIHQRAGGSGPVTVSDTQAMTMTIYSRQPEPSHQNDAGWSAFVAAYRASSELKSETRVCLPSLN